MTVSPACALRPSCARPSLSGVDVFGRRHESIDVSIQVPQPGGPASRPLARGEHLEQVVHDPAVDGKVRVAQPVHVCVEPGRVDHVQIEAVGAPRAGGHIAHVPAAAAHGGHIAHAETCRPVPHARAGRRRAVEQRCDQRVRAPAQCGPASVRNLRQPEGCVILVGVQGDERADGAEGREAVWGSDKIVEWVVWVEQRARGQRDPALAQLRDQQRERRH
mmetsp:Transcript_8273/g.27307  ORF Transcript_8273/g.27307 Transcript_8273/m.27307 type:complete len:219 (+) Transcript_8273:111-767(+)|eukprot:scaffold23021_cov135-Isochrysis_galbana.AAC.1